MSKVIDLWGDWHPRWYQLPTCQAFTAKTRGGRRKYDRFFLRWSRRNGKDWTSWRLLIEEALKRRANYGYFFPTMVMGRDIIFEGISKDGRGYMDSLPKEIISRCDTKEMHITLCNGSTIQIDGTDRLRIVGMNLQGVVMSEYAIQNPLAWTYLSPMLDENGGWAIFATTLRSKNHAYQLWKNSEGEPGWFRSKYTSAITGSTPMTNILRSLQDGSRTVQYTLQEHFASSKAGLENSTFASEIQTVRDSGRMMQLSVLPNVPIYSAWDLGYSDYMSVWIFQYADGKLLIHRHYMDKQKPLTTHIAAMDELMPGIGHLILPWDSCKHEMDGFTIKEKLMMLGRRVHVVPKSRDLDSDLNLVREWFPKMYFDKETTNAINHLEMYDSTVHGERGTKTHGREPSHVYDSLRTMVRAAALNIIGKSGLEQEEKDDKHDDGSWGGRVKVREERSRGARHHALRRVRYKGAYAA